MRPLFGLLLGSLLSLGAALADERILSFDVDIIVSQDGGLTVHESIVVRAEGNRIRRGIYRDFPTDYEDRFGNRVRVRYEPISVLRDGQPEDFFSDRLRNGVRTYFGSAERRLQPGVYRYDYRYRVSRVLGFFDEHDELYWNVTGLDWAFAIDKASARVELNFAGSPSIQKTVAYTGYAGAQGDDYTASSNGATALFETTRILSPHQGLTIAVTWPKGFVTAPSALQQRLWQLQDNLNLLIVIAGILCMLGYLVPVWYRYGRDPEEGVIVTRYEPPEGLSPGSLRFVQQMYYDDKIMTAAVISLAVKGYLRIDETGSEHKLIKSTPERPVELPDTEQVLYRALFAAGDSLTVSKDNWSRLANARSVHRAALRAGYRGRYFKKNARLSLPALFIGIAATILGLATGPKTPFVIIGVAAMMPIYLFFTIIMKRPTVLGQRAIEQILGFREYLDIAEKDELNLRNPPEKTPELFERYLPFALALGVEQRWAERFASVLAGASAAEGGSYQPTWYNGGGWSNFRSGAAPLSIADDLGSAISSSSSPPGTSSGVSSGGGFSGGGGGFSGGGGGGGGGGGW